MSLIAIGGLLSIAGPESAESTSVMLAASYLLGEFLAWGPRGAARSDYVPVRLPDLGKVKVWSLFALPVVVVALLLGWFHTEADHEGRQLVERGKLSESYIPKYAVPARVTLASGARDDGRICDGDATAMEVAVVMAQLHSPLVTVIDAGRFVGVITIARLIALMLPSP